MFVAQCYLYLTQQSLYLPLLGQEEPGDLLHAPVLVTDHEECLTLSTLLLSSLLTSV